MRIQDLNWPGVEAYLRRDDRCVLPLGCTEQHATLSLATDTLLAERVAVEAAGPLGVPVFPALPYGITPTFTAYPGTLSLRVGTYLALLDDLLTGLHAQGFRRPPTVNGHGGNSPGQGWLGEWLSGHPDARVQRHNGWNASRMENFPWTRLEGAPAPQGRKPLVDLGGRQPRRPARAPRRGDAGRLGALTRPGATLLPMTAAPDYDWLYSRTRSGRARGPHGARRLLDLLGSPDRSFASVRVVGTNGKGSTCAMLEAGLLAAGVRVGRFTSPHLTQYEERVRVRGHDLDPAHTAEFIAWAKQHAPDVAFFDLTLALACREFARSGVELAVMEAGVGGVSDATGALTRVLAVALTNVDLDHTATLGPGVREIARDKAGAARPGVPLLTTATGEALEVVREVTAEVGAPLLAPDTHRDLFALPHPPRMAGPHQRTNAALAAATLRTLGRGEGVEAALNATHPARLERFEVGGKTVLLDGAHNPHAARALAAGVGRVDVLLFGGLARKDTAATLAPLLEVAPVRVFTTPGPGATPPADLARDHGGEAWPDPARALERGLAITPVGGTLLVAGSLYLAGTLRALLAP